MRLAILVALFPLVAVQADKPTSVVVPGLPPPGPHLHYEFRVSNKPLRDADRLQAACDFVHYLSSDLKKLKKTSKDVESDVSFLRSVVCPAEKKTD